MEKVKKRERVEIKREKKKKGWREIGGKGEGVGR